MILAGTVFADRISTKRALLSPIYAAPYGSLVGVLKKFGGSDYMATEREYVAKILKAFRGMSNTWVYRPYDMYGGPKRPFDFLLTHEGLTCWVEAKMRNEKLKSHQLQDAINAYRAGLRVFVMRIYPKSGRTPEKILFKLLIDGKESDFYPQYIYTADRPILTVKQLTASF